MKFTNFLNKSLIAGVASAQVEIENWLRKQEANGFSYVGSLILLSLHFEEESNIIGPAKMAKHFRCSRGRISQELTKLSNQGFIKRQLSPTNARSVSLKLTAQGNRAANELVKKYSRLQNILDKTIGERQAENITAKLNELAVSLRNLN